MLRFPYFYVRLCFGQTYTKKDRPQWYSFLKDKIIVNEKFCDNKAKCKVYKKIIEDRNYTIGDGP